MLHQLIFPQEKAFKIRILRMVWLTESCGQRRGCTRRSEESKGVHSEKEG